MLKIAKEASVGVVRTWGRRQIGSVIIGGVAYVYTPAAKLVTNSTAIINGTKRVHSAVTFVIECADDLGGVAYLPTRMRCYY